MQVEQFVMAYGVERVYPKQSCTIENAAAIPCIQVLGTYTVGFQR